MGVIITKIEVGCNQCFDVVSLQKNQGQSFRLERA
ncbi:hypothetical protein DEU53_110105 [Pantoea sp. AG1095]|jgi:hypothetical protein|nr:hypothetical protein [Pantoea sp. SORGH_AS_0659]PYG47074.1 hypothetical protein DEU53_110105 [Pantoea sp. AG1095]